MSSVFEPEAGDDITARDATDARDATPAGAAPAGDAGGDRARDDEGDAVGGTPAGAEGDARGGTPAGAEGPVILVTVYDPVEAEIIVGKLRSAGIETYARHDAMSVVYGLTVDGFGQQDIMVHPEDLADAMVALEQAP